MTHRINKEAKLVWSCIKSHNPSVPEHSGVGGHPSEPASQVTSFHLDWLCVSSTRRKAICHLCIFEQSPYYDCSLCGRPVTWCRQVLSVILGREAQQRRPAAPDAPREGVSPRSFALCGPSHSRHSSGSQRTRNINSLSKVTLSGSKHDSWENV